MHRLTHRLRKIEDQRRPAVVQRILCRARTCPAHEVRKVLMRELTGLDDTTFTAVMAQLSDTEFETLADKPGLMAWLDTLPLDLLEALAARDPNALALVEEAWAREKGA